MIMEDFERVNIQQQIDMKNQEINNYNQQIKNMNAQISDLKARKEIHAKLKADVQNIILKLGKAKTSLSNAKTKLVQYYTSEDPASKANTSKTKITNNMEDISGIKDHLESKIIPAITSKMSEIDNQIKTIEGQISNIQIRIQQNTNAIKKLEVRSRKESLSFDFFNLLV